MTNTTNIKEIINKYFELDISKKTRQREYIEARFIYFTLVKKYTGLSLAAIAKTTSQNHATVLHGIKKLKDLMLHDKRLKFNYKLLDNKVADNDSAVKDFDFTEGLVQRYLSLKQTNEELTKTINELTEKLDLTREQLRFFKEGYSYEKRLQGNKVITKD